MLILRLSVDVAGLISSCKGVGGKGLLEPGALFCLLIISGLAEADEPDLANSGFDDFLPGIPTIDAFDDFLGGATGICVLLLSVVVADALGGKGGRIACCSLGVIAFLACEHLFGCL